MRRSKRTLSLEEKMLNALLKQKRKYERYLNPSPGIPKKAAEGALQDEHEGAGCDGKTKNAELDHKAEHAYTHIIKTIIEISRRSLQPQKNDPEDMKRIAEEILESEYGIKRN